MTTPLKTTFEILSKTRNDSSVTALLAALEHNDPSVFEGVMKCLISRRNKVGHLAVLKRWHQLSPPQRELLTEGRGRMSGAIRDAVLVEDDDQLFQNACELVEQFGEFDLVPTLVTLAENQKSKHAEAATALVLRLVTRLSELVHAPRDYKDRRDPQAMRRYVVESLERSVERFRQHKRTELIEALVTLNGSASGLLRKILDDPHHGCYLTVITTLTHSESAGVIELLINSLQSEYTSLNLLHVISKRTDKKFVDRLLLFASEKLSLNTVKNLKRIHSFTWLQSGERGFATFEDEDQARCITLVGASGMNQSELLRLLETIFQSGGPAGKLAACKTLASIPGGRADRLVFDAINDSNPEVQAAVARQIRDRHLPGTMPILIKLLDSEHEIVLEAAREALSEFSFEKYLASYNTLHEESRRSNGSLVKKVDPSTLPCLQEELASKSRKHRIQAIEIIEVMNLVAPMSDDLIKRLEEDDDHLVRAAAAEVLQGCPTPQVLEALRHARTDRSVSVQHAANNSLIALGEVVDAEPMQPAGGTL